MRMKQVRKYIAVAMMLLLCTASFAGCKKGKNKEAESESVPVVTFETGMFASETASEKVSETPEEKHTTIEGVRQISFYRRNPSTKVREKKTEFTAPWVRGTDISSFEVFACEDSEITFKTAYFDDAFWEKWNAFEGKDNCKIGYSVDFDLKSGEHIHKVLLKAGDELEYRPYLENYLYDDVHQAKGAWYSHLLPEEMNENTLITSIKFTPGEKIDEVGDEIHATVFVYNSEEDFDDAGEYIGDVSAEIIIRRAEVVN